METIKPTLQMYASEEVSRLADQNPEFMQFLNDSVESYIKEFSDFPDEMDQTVRKYDHDAGCIVIATLKKKFIIILFENQS